MPKDDDLIDGLRALGFRASAESLHALFGHATKSRLGAVESVEQLCVLERRERETRNLRRRTRTACLGTVTALDTFDWAHPREIDRQLIERLFTLDFLDRGDNVLFRGPSGVGKSMLAQCLGLEALARGRTVRFATLAEALGDLVKQESLPALDRRLKRYASPDVLILDEMGYLPCDSRAADLLYTIVSRRHEKASTVITTNLSFKQWGTVFPGAACIAAMVDRFAQHCHTVDIDADSWRQKNSTTRSSGAPKPPRTPPKPKRR
ncbi:MAG: IS21-like element helper ATPase IstB [Caldimonas sp.]